MRGVPLDRMTGINSERLWLGTVRQQRRGALLDLVRKRPMRVFRDHPCPNRIATPKSHSLARSVRILLHFSPMATRLPAARSQPPPLAKALYVPGVCAADETCLGI